MHDNQKENAGTGNTPADNCHNDGDELRKAVLARLPDLEEDRQNAAEPSVSPNGGRLLSAGLSRKLLVGCGLALVLVAVVPLLFSRGDDWKTRRPAPDADAAPAWNGDNTQVSSEGTVRQSADSNSVPQPNLPNVPTHDAASEGGMKIDMPDIPDLGMQPSADTNRSVAIAGVAPQDSGMHEAEHRANRQVKLSSQPGVARLEGTIEKISLRPTHDESRPGVY